MNDNVILPGPPKRNAYGPLSPSEMFERTFALLRENPGLFFGIVLVVIGVEIVVGAVLGGGGFWMGRFNSGAAPIARALFVAPLAFLGGALIYIFAQIIHGALFVATRAKLANALMTVGDACRLAADKTGRLIGIAILIALRIIGYVVLLDIVAVILVVIGFAAAGVHHHFSQNAFHYGHGPALGFGILLGSFLLAVLIAYLAALLWVVVRYAVAIPAALAENLPVTDAIHRSISLTRGSKGRLIALYLLVGCVSIAIAALTVPLQLMSGHRGTMHSEGLLLAAAAIRILSSWVIMAFMGVATTLCYYDLRVRKEGFGMELVTPIIAVSPAAAVAPNPDYPIEDLPVS
jgi:hypothetical protein